ncbi:MAG: hypothetical protein K2R98_23375 [Gemmataceae bacterium]|nr:hypothetical protein [Gemmataceae bacterium]
MLPSRRIATYVGTLLLAISPAPFARAESADRSVAARVNGEPIYTSEVKLGCLQELAIIEKLPEDERPALTRKVLDKQLRGIIDAEVMRQDAARRLKSQPEEWKAWQKRADEATALVLNVMKLRAAGPGGALSDEQFTALLAKLDVDVKDLKRLGRRQNIATEYLRRRLTTRLGKDLSEVPAEELEKECQVLVKALKQRAAIEVLEPKP